MKIKDSKTAILTLHEGMKFCCYVVQNVWSRYTKDEPIVSGGQEVGHSEKSLHYGDKKRSDPRCRALDFDSPGLSLEHIRYLRQDLERRLGSCFQVLPCFLIKKGDLVTRWEPTYNMEVLENTPPDSIKISHIHIELDPTW